MAVVPRPERRYAPTTWCDGPSLMTVPLFKRMDRSHRRVIAGMLWETKSTVRPRCPTSSILPRHFFWNAASPTARTSSTSRISGSRCAATAKARRRYMPGRVVLDGRVDELLDLGERDDLVELPLDLAAAHAEDGAVQIDVLAAGQLRMEAGADLEQRADAAVDLDAPRRRLGDARQDLQQRALAGAVAADDADDLAAPDLERHVAAAPRCVSDSSAARRPRRRRGTHGPERRASRRPRPCRGASCSAPASARAGTACSRSSTRIAALTHARPTPRRRRSAPSAGSKKRRRSRAAQSAARRHARSSGPAPSFVPSSAQRNPSTTPTIGFRPYSVPPGLGQQAARIDDRRREHPELGEERDV